MNAKEFQRIVTELSNRVDLAIHIVDRHETSVVYNENMAKVEKIRREDVLGNRFLEVFTHIKKEDSTLWRALHQQKETLNVQQTYLNAYGKEITTVNSTFPVTDENGEVIAAIEIARDITDIKDLSNTVLELRNRTIEPKKTEKSPIRRYSFDDIIGNNLEFKAVINRAKRAALTDASVFIYGETGTGKELFAQSIHFAGDRADKPFLAQNCAALPESLLEGILFGTSKGGFTGAMDRAGLFEQANGGTILLDELNAMPYDLQSKLLRVLQENYIRRVGGAKDIPVDVRVIAAVNEDPALLIESGKLRADLYYRINIVNISIPPLRERKDDIPTLIDAFIEKHNERFKKQIWMLSDRAMDRLKRYNYPGNVRELENIIMSAVSMAEREHVLTENMLHIPEHSSTQKKAESYDFSEQSLDEYLEQLEMSIIKAALADNGGNISRTAQQLSLKRQTLQHKLKKYALTK